MRARASAASASASRFACATMPAASALRLAALLLIFLQQRLRLLAQPARLLEVGADLLGALVERRDGHPRHLHVDRARAMKTRRPRKTQKVAHSVASMSAPLRHRGLDRARRPRPCRPSCRPAPRPSPRPRRARSRRRRRARASSRWRSRASAAASLSVQIRLRCGAVGGDLAFAASRAFCAIACAFWRASASACS